MRDDRLVQDALPYVSEHLAIVEKYEDFLNYVYPIALNLPRKHAVLRDLFMKAALDQVRLFAEAAKTTHISKLHVADSGLALLRFHLRFMAGKPRELVSRNQLRTASCRLAEVGGMLNSWIKGWEGKPKKG